MAAKRSTLLEKSIDNRLRKQVKLKKDLGSVTEDLKVLRIALKEAKVTEKRMSK